uniref:Uncharacterized protein n=1 Tax=Candidatus Kentrum sp. LPFa TaxID=2126335 RepID=A0A450XSA8_9GAMM|nr:MAG: hypothetical protein BECKLPF1236C_GA0070990_101598 [Candidatus Kentron sp. LPFa]
MRGAGLGQPEEDPLTGSLLRVGQPIKGSVGLLLQGATQFADRLIRCCFPV